MSDALAVSIIGALGAVVAATLSVINSIILRSNSRHIEETKLALVLLERNTNGIRAELVKVTGEAEHAKGKLEGQAEGKANLNPRDTCQDNPTA